MSRICLIFLALLIWAAVPQTWAQEDPFEPTPLPFIENAEDSVVVVDENLIVDEDDSDLLDADLIGTALFNFSVLANQDDPIAIFRRGRNLWLVVARPNAFDRLDLDANARKYVQLIEDISTPENSIMRVILDERINPRIVFGSSTRGVAGQEMLLFFYQQSLQPKQEISVEVEVDQLNGRPYILIADRDSRELVEIFDPEIGQRIVVLPTNQEGYGISRQYEYPDAEIFPSYQGGAVMLKRDDLLVRRYDFGYTVNAQDSLNISYDSTNTRRALVALSNRFIDAEEWSEIRPSNFLETRTARQQAIVDAPTQKRTDPRLSLATLYLSLGWGSEAESILRYALEKDNSLSDNKTFNNYRLVADYFNHRYSEVEAELNNPEFLGLRDASIWRAGLMAQEERWGEAFTEFEKSESILRRYPAQLRNHFGLLYVRAAMNIQRYDVVKVWLDVVRERMSWLPPFERNTYEYLRAQYALVEKDWSQARIFFEGLVKRDDIINQVNARYALLSMDRREGNIDDLEMIDELGRLLIDARQLPVEKNIMGQMIDIMLSEKRYLEAMRLMRNMTSLELGEDENRRLVERMQATLNNLFLNFEQTSDVLPLRMVAIFDEFRELTPVGERGNRIINGLVRQLVRMDLLDQAEDMLAYQIRYRVFGQEKVRLGTKLAVVALLNNNPTLALKALNETQFGNIPRKMGRHRRLLLAFALAELGEKEEALKQLAGDISLEADLIRREIFWRDKDWSELAKTIRRLVSSINPGATRINDTQARFIMNWVVALLMDNNQVGVQEVVSQYRDQMVESKFGPLFSFLVADNRRSSKDSVQRVLDDTFVYNSFMDTYQEQLLDNTFDAFVLEDIDDSLENASLINS